MCVFVVVLADYSTSPHSTASVRLQKERCYHVTELKDFNRTPPADTC